VGECLIAAVRAEHVESARGRAELMGRVQFGASDAAFFDKLVEDEKIGKLPVYLFPTKHNAPGNKQPSGRAFLKGVLDSVAPTPDPSLRPDATSSDTEWKVYWTVRIVPEAGERADIGDFKTASGKAHSSTPRRPLIAFF
jgi:hypothetical protein